MSQLSYSSRLHEFSPTLVSPLEGRQLQVNNLLMWGGVLGGPIAWFVHLLLMYPLVELACRRSSESPLVTASAVLFATAALAGLSSYRYVRYMRQYDGDTVPRRVRFMATAGCVAALLFMVLIVGGTLPVLFDDPCQLQGRRVRSLLPHL
jgi:hypothetical protein